MSERTAPPGPSGSQVYTVASGGRVPPVAIPRLPPVDTSLVEPARKRVGHACEPCRQQKAKCSGERPRCNRCAELNLECVYAAGKRVQHERYNFLRCTITVRLAKHITTGNTSVSRIKIHRCSLCFAIFVRRPRPKFSRKSRTASTPYAKTIISPAVEWD